ncbi:t-SNARE [Morchella snyderi]|nr:t-SNARE [Morchella snyderi]
MSGNGYEMETHRAPLLEPNQYAGGHQAMELQEFLNEVTGIRNLISTFRQNVLNISSLHNQSLQSYDHGSTTGSSGQLEALVADTSILTKQLRDGIKYLERDTLMSDYSAQSTKGVQTEKLKSDFDKELKAYQQVENQFRTRYRDQMSRQYRIVNPEATDAEVEQLVESGETQIFSQALLSSGRSREANSVNAAVKARQQEIQRIETTLIELLQLFEQMAEQVVLDEAKFQQIEDNAVKVEEDVHHAANHLETGVVSAKAARKKKWMCLGLGVTIVVVIVIIVVVVVVVKNGGVGGGNNNNDKSTETVTATTTAPAAATSTAAT